MFAFLAGWRMYAALGVLALILGLGGVVYVQSLRLDAATERIKRVETEKAELRDALAQSEADKARLLEAQRQLDLAVKEQQKRLKELNDAKQRIAGELDALKRSLPKEDQDCLDRPLPDALYQRLFVAEPADENGKGAGAGSPLGAVPDQPAEQ